MRAWPIISTRTCAFRVSTCADRLLTCRRKDTRDSSSDNGFERTGLLVRVANKDCRQVTAA